MAEIIPRPLDKAVESLNSKFTTIFGPKITVGDLSLASTGEFTKDITNIPQTLDGKSFVAVILYSSSYRLVTKGFAGATLYYSVVSASSGNYGSVNLIPVYQ